MSMMHCQGCDRLVDTDYEVGEYFEQVNLWLCDQCICDEDILAEHGIQIDDDGNVKQMPKELAAKVEEMAARTAYGSDDESA